MNRNTKRARKGSPKDRVEPVSNQIEITIGTGAGRQFGARNYELLSDIKGKPCNTARPAGKKKWVGALRSSKGSYGE